MTVTVYWACLEDEWMSAAPPESVSKHFYKKNKIDTSSSMSNVGLCPGFNLNLKNLFTLKSLYDYEFSIMGNEVGTNTYDQAFFEAHVGVRSLEKKLFAFRNRYIFFSDSSSLLTTMYEYPYLEDNNITQNCIPITGMFDIGKWFRESEYTFYLKEDRDSFKIQQEEVYAYVRFHTDQDIRFQQFRYSNVFDDYQKDCYSLTKLHLQTFERYYPLMKTKKLILKEILKRLV